MKLDQRKTGPQDRAKFTVASIFQAARELLETTSDKVTASRLAERAGISVGSLYQYFPSLDAVVLSLMSTVLNGQINEIENILHQNRDSSLEKKVHSVIAYYVSAVAKKPRTTQFFAKRFLLYGKSDFLSEADKRLVNVFQSHLASHESELRKEDLELPLFFVIQSIRLIPTATLMTSPQDFDQARMTDELTDLALRYLKN